MLLVYILLTGWAEIFQLLHISFPLFCEGMYLYYFVRLYFCDGYIPSTMLLSNVILSLFDLRSYACARLKQNEFRGQWNVVEVALC